MTLGGWLNLILSVGLVTGLLGWCVVRLIATADKTGLARVEPVEENEADQR